LYKSTSPDGRGKEKDERGKGKRWTKRGGSESLKQKVQPDRQGDCLPLIYNATVPVMLGEQPRGTGPMGRVVLSPAD
jgi:hypothetical protein